MSAFYGGTESIDDIIATLDEALKGNIGEPDIPVEMTTTTLLNHTTIHILEDGTINEIILPIIDLKAILLEYKDFLNTPPFKGTRG